MPFIEEILKYKSLSIVGIEKNTGKTECLNFIINKLKYSNKNIAITSIGIDGEKRDLVTNTHKPEIEIFENVVFITSEMHYKQKKITAEILEISEKTSALGRLITAKSKSCGKVIFSGPSSTAWLKSNIDNMYKYNIDTTIVDGALSRMSQASPAITQSMILTTGAAVSSNIKQLVSKTKYVYELINLPLFVNNVSANLFEIESGIWSIDEKNNIHNLNIPSAFLIEQQKEKLFQKGNILYFTGVLNDNVLLTLLNHKNIKSTIVIVKDFTKIFANQQVYYSFVKKGGKIFVLAKSTLIAVCINPTSPQGYNLNSELVCSELSKELNVSVYDLKSLPV